MIEFGHPPSDEDVEECIVQALEAVKAGYGETYENLFNTTKAMVRGDLTHSLFISRVLALREQRAIVVLREKYLGRGKLTTVYRLRVASDNEKPQWNYRRTPK